MATRSTWDLSAGSDFDFSGNKEIRESNKMFSDAQRIIADAYKLDETAATQDLRIEATNTKNREYVDDVAAQNELRKLLSDEYDINEESSASTVEIPTTKSATSEGMSDGSLTQYERSDQANIPPQDGQVREAQAPGQTAVQIKENKPAQTIQRRATLTEKIDRALSQTTNPRVILKLQDMKQAEVVKTASTLATTDPVAALDVLRKSGNQYVPQLQRTPTGYKQILPDGREMNVDELQAAFLVGDVIKGSGDRLKYIKDIQSERAKQQFDNAKSARDQAERLQLEEVKFKFASDLERQKLEGRAALQNARGGKYARQIGFDENGNAVYGAGGGGGGSERGGARESSGEGGDEQEFFGGKQQPQNAKNTPSKARTLKSQIEAVNKQTDLSEIELELQKLSTLRREITAKNVSDNRIAPIDELREALRKRQLALKIERDRQDNLKKIADNESLNPEFRQ